MRPRLGTCSVPPSMSITACKVANALCMRHATRARSFLGRQLASLSQFQDPTQPLYTTPRSRFGRRIHYDIKEYDPLLDSSNMSYVRRSFARSLGCLIAAIADRRADHDLPRPSRTGNASRPTSTPATTTTMRSWCCMAPTPWATRRRPCRSCSRISPRPSSSPARRSRSPRCATMASTISWVP